MDIYYASTGVLIFWVAFNVALLSQIFRAIYEMTRPLRLAHLAPFHCFLSLP